MKTLIALLLLCSPAVAQTPLDISIAIAIAEAEAAQTPAAARSTAKPAEIQKDRSEGQPAKSTVRAGYPVRGSWWSGCGDWTHLTRGEHAGLFDHDWLRSLSNAELQSLHSDHHEGRTKWAFVVRATAAATPTRVQSCPGGVCPSSSYSTPSRGGIFRRWR